MTVGVIYTCLRYHSLLFVGMLASLYGIYNATTVMKHYRAKPSAQLPKHIKSLQDDTKHAVMKPETSLNWINHKNVHCIQLRNVHVRLCTYVCVHRFLFAGWANHVMSQS